MSKLQLFVVASSVLFFSILYFGFDTKAEKIASVEKSREFVAESTDISILLKDAKEKLSSDESNTILALEHQLEQTTIDSLKTSSLKKISGEWYRLGNPTIAGYYAESVADIVNDDESWSIAGTTYLIGVQKATEDKVKSYASNRAIKAFENAISLNPSNSDHQVNLALCYVEKPPEDNPMKGIQMLLSMNKKEPENTGVLTQLGRLGMQTGQFEKAIGRLEKVIVIEPNNSKAVCLLAQAYEGAGNKAKANEFLDKCKTLSK